MSVSLVRALPPLPKEKPPKPKKTPVVRLAQQAKTLARKVARLEGELQSMQSLLHHDSVMRAKGLLLEIDRAARNLEAVATIAAELRQAHGYERSVDQRIERFMRETGTIANDRIAALERRLSKLEGKS